MKKICLKSFLILSVLISFCVSKSSASSDIVILNTNNSKYHKIDCEYAKYIKNGKNIRKPLIRYSSAVCCFPQKEKYVVDFICRPKKIIIEIDGGQHNTEESIVYDKKRSEDLNKLGYKVLRFWNNDIDNNLEGVYKILQKEFNIIID